MSLDVVAGLLAGGCARGTDYPDRVECGLMTTHSDTWIQCSGCGAPLIGTGSAPWARRCIDCIEKDEEAEAYGCCGGQGRDGADVCSVGMEVSR